MTFQVFIGFDSREVSAYQVCVHSLRSHASCALAVEPILEPHVRALGMYRRHHELRDGRLWDTLSAAPMSTEFALTRFLTPVLCQADWAVFCDCDFLWRTDVAELLSLADPRYASWSCSMPTTLSPASRSTPDPVGLPTQELVQPRTVELPHPAHAPLPELVNTWTGRRLHAFGWLEDELIGSLPEAWNWLEGHSSPALEAKAVHFTRGTPDLPGYRDVAYASEWHRARCR